MKLSLRLLAALLLLSPSLSVAQYDPFLGGKNKVRYDVFEWKVYETPHFRISYYDRVEPSLERVASFAESSYDELARKLNFQIGKPIPLITYATHAEFEQTNIMEGFIPEGVGAFATPVRNRMVLPVDMPDTMLQAIIQHELTHIFQYEILFQGRVMRALYRQPPQWFMEGMASYLGADETTHQRTYMRDAAFSDRVPSVEHPPEGYLAYRYGHKVFEYVEKEWGEEGLREFIFAFRNTFGSRVKGPFERALNMTPEDFDAAFRAWLRKQYVQLSERGTPEEFGRRFRTGEYGEGMELSPVASPSGDLVAAFSTYKNDVDVVLLGVPDRRLYRNLTPGQTARYQYLVAQELTVAGDRGRDLAFSPDGNQVAVFARFERTRKLLLLDATNGRIAREVAIPLPIDQPMEPAFAPDGRHIAFRAVRGGHYDIFMVDLADGSIVNLTQDDAYDAAPVFSPDGLSVVYSSQSGESSKLIELEVADPTKRRQLTFGPGNDEGAAFSRDGKRLYFASDRVDGVFDIFELDLSSNAMSRLTHVIGAALNPVPLVTLDGERVVFQAYGRGRWELYEADPNKGEPVGAEAPPQEGPTHEAFIPAVSIPIDLTKGAQVKRHKLFLENARAFVGYDQYSRFLSQVYLSFSDQYGDRRFEILADSVDTFSNFQLSYLNMEPRLQWGGMVFDDRSYYVWGYDPIHGGYSQREEANRETGGAFITEYPLSRKYRLDGEVGYIDRSAVLPTVGEGGQVSFDRYSDQIPFVDIGVVGDTTRWQEYGPHRGARWQLDLFYGADVKGGGTLTANAVFEGRAYVPLSQRNELALRLYAAIAEGNLPTTFAFGGMETVHGLPIWGVAGNRAGFVNVQWRFPLVDRLDLAFMRLSDIRGRMFVDVGAAWFDINGARYNFLGDPGFTFIRDGRLVDGVAAYGFGVTLDFFGLPLNWDFSRQWDFKQTGSLQTDFWIGFEF